MTFTYKAAARKLYFGAYLWKLSYSVRQICQTNAVSLRLPQHTYVQETPLFSCYMCVCVCVCLSLTL